MADNTRKQADKILKSEQLENRTTNVLIFGIDADGRVNEWNQTAERITHYSKDEVMDRDLVKNFITDEYKESVKQVLDKALTG
ncbi:MAG: PAS domain-containing protein, partial [Chloroflexi bacterium]|nr:PAS domain-containing protein [Chloroflexota bacterium]